MNRFYLFISIFLIHFIGFSQDLVISIDNGASTYECIEGSDPAQALINVDQHPGVNGSDIEYQVVDSFGNDVETGFFNNQFNTKIQFDQPGEYSITASITAMSLVSAPVTFIVNPSLDEIENSTILDEYYLCNGQKEIDIEIQNASSYNFTSIIVNSENTYVGDNGNFPAIANANLVFDSTDYITSIIFYAEDDICSISDTIYDIAILTGPTEESSVISLPDSDALCLDAGSTDNIINLSVVDEEFTISDFDTSIGPFSVDSLPINLQGVYEELITIEYDSIDCTINKTHTINYGVIYDTEFTISKIKVDGSQVLEEGNIDLCNDEKIVLTNTSVHRSECPSCFEWLISGSPADLIIDDDLGTATFSYDLDDPAAIWKLVYTEDTGFCSDSLIKNRAVNVDYIDAGFVVTPAVICAASGDVEMISDSSVGDSEYTYSWNLNNNNGLSFSSNDTLALISLSSPGVYDASLLISSETGCNDSIFQSDVLTVTGNTDFVIDKRLSDGNFTNYNEVLCNDEQIRLTNTSVYLSTCPECFEWNISGAPTDLIIDSLSGTALFSYSDDNIDVTWSLINSALCVEPTDTIIDVNVDYINPILSDDLIQLSCSFDTVIDLSHETILGTDVTDDYTFTWTVLYDQSIASVIPPSISGFKSISTIYSNFIRVSIL